MYRSGVAEGRRRPKRIQRIMTRRLFSHIQQTESNAYELLSCGQCCTFVVLLARPQNSCIPSTHDRQTEVLVFRKWRVVPQMPVVQTAVPGNSHRRAVAGVGTKLTIQTDCCGHSHAGFGSAAVVLLLGFRHNDDRQNSTRGFSQKSISGDIDSSGSGMR